MYPIRRSLLTSLTSVTQPTFLMVALLLHAYIDRIVNNPVHQFDTINSSHNYVYTLVYYTAMGHDYNIIHLL